MARDGSNIYSAPSGTLAVSGTTIESAKYNAFVNDLVADANLPRPIVAGGTGATTAAGILAATGVTASVAEVNVLDGVTATTAELNILDGVTATAAELNILDGATLTTTELNYVDGVTSAIQTQLDAKAPVIADPNADRIRFWDDSVGAEAWLTVGSGLTLTDTTLTANPGWTLVSSSSTWTGGTQTVTGLGGYSRVMFSGVGLSASVSGTRRVRVGSGSILSTSIYARAADTTLQSFLECTSTSTAERSFTIVIERFNTTDAAKPVIFTGDGGAGAPIAIISASQMDRIQVFNQSGDINGGTLYVWGKV